MTRLPPAMVGAGSDPVERASAWLDEQLAGRPLPPLLVVIGLGEGYLLDALERRGNGSRVLALEPDPAVVPAFLARRDWSAWRQGNRLAHFVGPDYPGADQAWRMFPSQPDDHILIVDPTVARDHREGARGAARLVSRIVFGARANAEARRQFAPRYLTNALRNAPGIVAGSDVRALTDVYRGLPAVIAAAGPSLDLALPPLRDLRGHALLIAVDTAVRPLLAAGLTPALAVGMDPSAKNARHFHDLPVRRDTWLVAEGALDPSAAAVFDDRTFWFRVADHHPWPWYRELGVDVGQLEVWGSVLTAAFQVAVLAGCDPIVVVGADLACSGGRPYARGTTYEYDWAYSAALGDDLGRAWQMQVAMFEQLRVPDLHGVETITTPPLQAFRDWMVAQAPRSGRRVINATGAGILFGPGIEQATLHDALPRRYDIPSPRNIARSAAGAGSRATIAAACRAARGRLADLSATPTAQWVEFSGGGFDTAATAAALGDAAHLLERGSTSTASAAELAVEPDMPGEHARPVMARLPESLARLREALTALEAIPPLPGANGVSDRARAALTAALGQLRALRAAVTACVADPSGPPLQRAAGSGPVTGFCVWPPSIAWPLQRYEALLGESCAAGAPGASASFFSRPVVVAQVSDAPAGTAAPPDLSPAGDRLALEWMICAGSVSGWPAAVYGRLLGLLRAHAFQAPESVTVDVMMTTTGSAADIAALRLSGARSRLARVLTGLVSIPTARGEETATSNGASAGPPPVVRLVLYPTHIGSVAAPYPAPLLLTPRVLTEEGVAQSILGYTVAAGAVVVPLLGRESLLIGADGAHAPHHAWPRPIVGELPLGVDGAVAWNNWPDSGPSYAMYRASAADAATVVDLPFKPTIGAWWGSRLYWSVMPSGLGWWAPGEAPHLAFEDLTLLAIHPDDNGLVLAPCVRDEFGAPRRLRVANQWLWRPQEELTSVPLGPDDVTSSRAAHGGWTALAHPTGHVVRLESDRGVQASIGCYRAFTVAWAGDSLLVATIEGELLLFEDLTAVLERWIADGNRPSQLSR